MKQLNLEKSLKLLKKYKINFVDCKKINKISDLKNFEYPAVLKVSSEKIIHKSDVGGVIIGIKDFDAAAIAFNRLKKISPELVIQKMISGKEVIIGMKKDAQFGPVIMFGLGGIFVEVMKDISFRICPVNKDEALKMIKEIKAYKVLEGIRGSKPVNLDKLAELIVNVSNLSLKEKIEEIDLNPVMVNEKEAIAVDVRFIE